MSQFKCALSVTLQHFCALMIGFNKISNLHSLMWLLFDPILIIFENIVPFN